MSNHGYAKDFYLLGSANILKKLDDLEKANDCLRIQISAREEVCEKYKKAIDEAIKYIDNLRDESAERQEFYNCFPDDLYIPNIKELLDILKEVSE